MNYFISHMQSSLYSLGKLTRTPFASLMTCIIIGIALALPGILFVALKNAEYISNSFKQTLQVTLYLQTNVSPGQVNNLLIKLHNLADVKKVQAISPVEGMKELENQAGLNTSLKNWPINPLPWAIVVQPANNIHTPELFAHFADQLKQLPLVESMQIDLLWVKRLTLFMALAHRLTYVLAIFLSIAVLLIVNNTIRSTTEQKRQEIEIIQLIGGTHAFIRRPFLYAGMTYGLIGGIIAWLFITLLVVELKAPVENLAMLYHSQFILQGLSFSNLIILLIGSILLGLIGSWIAVTKYLFYQNNQ